jgi:putative peptide zinc metalloprotease protein
MQAGASEKKLPRLRPDLALLAGTPDVSGAPRWLIHDPLQNQFVQIDSATYHTLALWTQCRTTADLKQAAWNTLGAELDEDTVAELLSFLEQYHLTDNQGEGDWRRLDQVRRSRQRNSLKTLLHSYIFFRIPLFHPQSLLERTLPLAEVFCGRKARLVLMTLSLVGAYLVSRQWESYLSSLQGWFNVQGSLLALLVLTVIKSLHELGHAYTAVRDGCRVPTIGVAFILLFPLLYTDVTDSWRLTDRKKRLAIDSAGIRVELAIAGLSLLLWAVMPSGPLKAVLFLVSAVSLLSTLAVNLNPFMRFDGYYLLSEAWGIENLQARSFAFGRWQLRETLFGLGARPPEDVPRRRRFALVAYAWATWTYRFFLFLAIALLIYAVCFKALGIVLLAAEIAILILKPVANEMKEWWRMRQQIIQTQRARITLASLAVAGVLLFMPWSSRVEIPAVVEFVDTQAVFSRGGGTVDQVHVAHGDEVRKGAALVTLFSPDIASRLEIAHHRLALTHQQFSRRGADAVDQAQSIILEQQISAHRTEIAALQRAREMLTVRAPFSGRIVEINPTLHAGRWMEPGQQLFIVADQSRYIATGVVEEKNMWRLRFGTGARFIPDQILAPSSPASIAAVSVNAVRHLERLELATRYGGPVATTENISRVEVPTHAHYLVTADVRVEPGTYPMATRGVLIADGRPQSFAADLWRQMLKVVMSEAGA